MILEDWKLVLGQSCKNCDGTGSVTIYSVPVSTGTTICPICRGTGIFIRLAKKSETLELLKMIPDLVQGAFEFPPSSSESCNGQKKCEPWNLTNPHRPDCRHY